MKGLLDCPRCEGTGEWLSITEQEFGVWKKCYDKPTNIFLKAPIKGIKSRNVCENCDGQGYTDGGTSPCETCYGVGMMTPELREALAQIRKRTPAAWGRTFKGELIQVSIIKQQCEFGCATLGGEIVPLYL